MNYKYWDVLTMDNEKVETLIMGLCHSCPDVFSMLVPNLTSSSFSNIREFLQVFLDYTDSINLKVNIEDNEYTLLESIYDDVPGRSFDISPVFRARKSIKRSFMILIMQYMTGIGYQTFDSYYEYENVGITEMIMDCGEIQEDIDAMTRNQEMQYQEMEAVSSIITTSIDYGYLLDVYLSLSKYSKKRFEKIMKIAGKIRDTDLRQFEFYPETTSYDSPASYLEMMTLHYDEDFDMTERYTDMINERIGNEWIINPTIRTPLGENILESFNFGLYVELIDELYKLTNEFIKCD